MGLEIQSENMREHRKMKHGMAAAMREATLGHLSIELQRDEYNATQEMEIPQWH